MKFPKMGDYVRYTYGQTRTPDIETIPSDDRARVLSNQATFGQGLALSYLFGRVDKQLPNGLYIINQIWPSRGLVLVSSPETVYDENNTLSADGFILTSELSDIKGSSPIIQKIEWYPGKGLPIPSEGDVKLTDKTIFVKRYYDSTIYNGALVTFRGDQILYVVGYDVKEIDVRRNYIGIVREKASDEFAGYGHYVVDQFGSLNGAVIVNLPRRVLSDEDQTKYFQSEEWQPVCSKRVKDFGTSLIWDEIKGTTSVRESNAEDACVISVIKALTYPKGTLVSYPSETESLRNLGMVLDYRSGGTHKIQNIIPNDGRTVWTSDVKLALTAESRLSHINGGFINFKSSVVKASECDCVSSTLSFNRTNGNVEAGKTLRPTSFMIKFKNDACSDKVSDILRDGRDATKDLVNAFSAFGDIFRAFTSKDVYKEGDVVKFLNPMTEREDIGWISNINHDRYLIKMGARKAIPRTPQWSEKGLLYQSISIPEVDYNGVYVYEDSILGRSDVVDIGPLPIDETTFEESEDHTIFKTPMDNFYQKVGTELVAIKKKLQSMTS